MNEEAHDLDAARLEAARETVRTFLVRKQRLTTGLFVAAGACEVLFFVLMLVFMDFSDQLYWFLLWGFLLVYVPLIIFTWRNSVKMDHLYYRLIYDLHHAHHDDEGEGASGA